MIDKQYTGSSTSSAGAGAGSSLYGPWSPQQQQAQYTNTHPTLPMMQNTRARATPSLLISTDDPHGAPSIISEPPMYTQMPPMQINDAGSAAENPFRSPQDSMRYRGSFGSFPIAVIEEDMTAPAPQVGAEEVVKPDVEGGEHAEGSGEEGEGKDKKKKRKLHPLLKGIIVLTLVCPAAAFVAAGTVVWGTGQVLVGVGDLMTGGPLKKTAKKMWKQRKSGRADEEKY